LARAEAALKKPTVLPLTGSPPQARPGKRGDLHFRMSLSCSHRARARPPRTKSAGVDRPWRGSLQPRVNALEAAIRRVTRHVDELATVVTHGTFLRRLRRLHGIAAVTAFPVCCCRLFFFAHGPLPIVCSCLSRSPHRSRHQENRPILDCQTESKPAKQRPLYHR